MILLIYCYYLIIVIICIVCENNKLADYIVCMFSYVLGAQWLSGRVLDSRPRGRGFKPHGRRCVVVLEQDTFILA